jgi:hypothetical protein
MIFGSSTLPTLHKGEGSQRNEYFKEIEEKYIGK